MRNDLHHEIETTNQIWICRSAESRSREAHTTAGSQCAAGAHRFLRAMGASAAATKPHHPPRHPIEVMTVLSIRQPWAYLIVHGYKDVENRTWPTRFRGRFLVHASGRPAPHMAALRERILHKFSIAIPLVLPTGGIVGEAELVSCLDCSPSPWWEEGCRAFVLRAGRPLPFIPCKGQLNFYPARPAIVQALQGC